MLPVLRNLQRVQLVEAVDHGRLGELEFQQDGVTLGAERLSGRLGQRAPKLALDKFMNQLVELAPEVFWVEGLEDDLALVAPAVVVQLVLGVELRIILCSCRICPS